jgi:hypothetical protein
MTGELAALGAAFLWAVASIFFGSSAKRLPVCYNHHFVVHQMPFARRLADFPVLLASGGTPKTR